MKKAHLEGRADSFPSRKNCEHSYPEKWLIGVLERELGLIENKDYETEYYFHIKINLGYWTIGFKSQHCHC